MKKVFPVLLLALSVSLTACKNSQNPVSGNEVEDSVEADSSRWAAAVLSPEKVMSEGAGWVNREVAVKGIITHVCKHGGKKCSIIGDDPSVFIQVMVGGEMKAFSQEQLGSTILVNGVVRERQITREMIAEQEKALREAAANMAEQSAESGEQHCSQSMQNVDRMKQWMETQKKDYYPVYYIEGTSCKVVE